MDITGQKYGRLTALSYSHSVKWVALWRFRCECGNEKVIRIGSVRSGRTKSCGCLMGEDARRKQKKYCWKHGRSGTPEWISWQQMTSRCRKPNNRLYKDYGGRGITVCERWNSFKNFLADMGLRPSLKHSIDRIDNNKGYSPENCRWATAREQSQNRRSSYMITFKGKTMNLSQWAAAIGFPYHTLSNRIRNLGWSAEDALTTPRRARRELTGKEIEWGAQVRG